MAELGVTADRVVLEVTESQLPDLTANDAIRELRRAGVEIALDDFGSGYSSFAQLVQLPVDIVKLDRAFAENVSQRSGEAVMRAVVELARSLDLAIVSEGIETDEQLQAARRAGVDLVQGFLFHRPLTAEHLEPLLRTRPALPAPRSEQSAAATAH